MRCNGVYKVLLLGDTTQYLPSELTGCMTASLYDASFWLFSVAYLLVLEFIVWGYCCGQPMIGCAWTHRIITRFAAHSYVFSSLAA